MSRPATRIRDAGVRTRRPRRPSRRRHCRMRPAAVSAIALGPRPADTRRDVHHHRRTSRRSAPPPPDRFAGQAAQQFGRQPDGSIRLCAGSVHTLAGAPRALRASRAPWGGTAQPRRAHAHMRQRGGVRAGLAVAWRSEVSGWRHVQAGAKAHTTASRRPTHRLCSPHSLRRRAIATGDAPPAPHRAVCGRRGGGELPRARNRGARLHVGASHPGSDRCGDARTC